MRFGRALSRSGRARVGSKRQLWDRHLPCRLMLIPGPRRFIHRERLDHQRPGTSPPGTKGNRPHDQACDSAQDGAIRRRSEFLTENTRTFSTAELANYPPSIGLPSQHAFIRVAHVHPRTWTVVLLAAGSASVAAPCRRSWRSPTGSPSTGSKLAQAIRGALPSPVALGVAAL